METQWPWCAGLTVIMSIAHGLTTGGNVTLSGNMHMWVFIGFNWWHMIWSLSREKCWSKSVTTTFVTEWPCEETMTTTSADWRSRGLTWRRMSGCGLVRWSPMWGLEERGPETRQGKFSISELWQQQPQHNLPQYHHHIPHLRWSPPLKKRQHMLAQC